MRARVCVCVCVCVTEDQKLQLDDLFADRGVCVCVGVCVCACAYLLRITCRVLQGASQVINFA